MNLYYLCILHFVFNILHLYFWFVVFSILLYIMDWIVIYIGMMMVHRFMVEEAIKNKFEILSIGLHFVYTIGSEKKIAKNCLFVCVASCQHCCVVLVSYFLFLFDVVIP